MEHDLELTSIHHILTERMTKKKAIQSGIDWTKHEEQKALIEKLEASLVRYQV